MSPTPKDPSIMKKLLAIPVIISIVLLALPALAIPPDGWFDRVPAAREAALDSGNLILVDLYADWCGWCRKLERDVFGHPEFVAYAKKFVKLKVNVEDGGEGSALQSRYRASTLPTTLLLTPDMVLVDKIQGYAPRKAFMGRLEQGISNFEKEQRTFAQILAGDDLMAMFSVARTLHERGDGTGAGKVYQRLLAEPSTPPAKRAQLLYMLADAQRMDENFDAAERSLRDSRKRALLAGDHAHLEACDLLHIRIAEDRGLCTATIAALKTFLDNHPTSGYRSEAQRSLARLNRTECT